MKTLVNMKFGDLLVIERVKNICKTDKKPHGRVAYLCKCNCGKSTIVSADDLRGNKTKSCGCKQSEREDLTGQTFGYWLVLDYYGQYKYWCICKCGTEKIVPAGRLKFGASRSCGCLRVEVGSKRTKNNNPNWNPELTERDRHSRREDKEYKIWRKSVLSRDNYRCKICNTKKHLVVHHLNSYAKYRKHRIDIGNGITLCRKCHRRYHTDCGWTNSTKQQFESWRKGEADIQRTS